MKQISRRDFLKGSVAGAAALGLASLGLGKTAVAFAEGEKKYTPGTYTASAKGINGDVTVSMTFDDTSITDVVIDVSGETADLGGKAGPVLEKAILEAQSADVDAYTGATVTSDAIRKAAAECISSSPSTSKRPA